MNHGEATETIEAFVLDLMRRTGAAPSVEFVQFSGKTEDVILKENACFLRVKATQRLDGDGNPYELVVRLSAPGGVWWIPNVETEMLALIPANLGEAPGVGWAISYAQSPPQKLDVGKAFWDLPQDVKLLARAGGWAFRSKDNTVFGIDKDTGKFQVSIANGSYVALDPTGPSFEVVIGDGGTPNHVLAALKLSATGVELLVSNAAGTTKQTWKIGADGNFTAFATGQATFGWKGGCLLGVPSGPPKPLVIWDTTTGLPIMSTMHSASG